MRISHYINTVLLCTLDSTHGHTDSHYLSSLSALGEHYHGDQLLLPNHPPEVVDGVGHGALGSNVGVLVFVAL